MFITTLDDAFGSQRDLYIDLLLSDSEKHDPFVFQGAFRLLSQGRIGVYVFELGASEAETLKMLSSFHRWHYTCYLPLERRREAKHDLSIPVYAAVKISDFLAMRGKHIVNGVALEGWMNCICVHGPTQPVLLQIMEGLTQHVLGAAPEHTFAVCPVYAFITNSTTKWHLKKASFVRNQKMRNMRREKKAKLVDEYFARSHRTL